MDSTQLDMTAPPDVYTARRARLASQLHKPIVIFSGFARARHYATNVHPFRANSNYLYFGGPPLEGAAWLIEPGSDGREGCTLFRPDSDFDEAVWVGALPSDEAIADASGVKSSSLKSPTDLESCVHGREVAAIYPPCPETLKTVKKLSLREVTEEEMLPIIDLRLSKDEHELKAMRRAADVGVKAHIAAMKACAVGLGEADVAAAIFSVLTSHQCYPSFTPIVSIRGEILHTEKYTNTLEAGQLLLVDSGAEEPTGYASDMTRTYPANGEFSPIQRQLYETVLRAEQDSIAACKPGTRFRDIHDLAARVICEGLVEAELLRGDPAELAARGVHTLFFVHGLGHLVGLDVHDMEDFGDLAGYAPGRTRRPEFGNKFLRLDRDLSPGMALTIEPGIYLVPEIWHNEALQEPFLDAINRPVVDKLLADNFGGIRIEETVVVREESFDGPEVLTKELPNDVDQVAKIVADN